MSAMSTETSPAEAPLKACRNHPAVQATWICDSCGEMFCDECVVVTPTKFGRFESCPQCEGKCDPVLGPGAGERPPFFALLPGAFGYPLRKDGLLIFVLGGVFFFLLRILMIIPVVGWILGAFAGGYLSTFLVRIISSSARGKDDLPDWPAFSGWWSGVLVPLSGVILTVLFAMLPAAVLLAVRFEGSLFDTVSAAARDPIFLLLFAFGLAYVPMALIALSIIGARGALNPFLVTLSILRVFGQYAVACLVLALLIGFSTVSHVYIGGKVPVLGPAVDGFLSLYLLVVETRILGLIYYANEERLGWLSRS